MFPEGENVSEINSILRQPRYRRFVLEFHFYCTSDFARFLIRLIPKVRSPSHRRTIERDFSVLEYNAEDRKDAREGKRGEKRERERERERETMKMTTRFGRRRNGTETSLGLTCMVRRFASQWQVI